ncbi:hypothetical protein [Floridanema evergladense]|uniref:Uncharacterized protein n=1 Tax=Floridaenema evergladense BLCC-F167 TaxID=3153639 RepID=A0ABV4WKI0_9CYAN
MRSRSVLSCISLFSAKFGKCDRVACSLAYRSFLCWWEKVRWIVFGYAIAFCLLMILRSLVNSFCGKIGK